MELQIGALKRTDFQASIFEGQTAAEPHAYAAAGVNGFGSCSRLLKHLGWDCTVWKHSLDAVSRVGE